MLSYTLRISLNFSMWWRYRLGTTCPPMCSLPVSAIRSAPPHSSSAWGVEKCADIKTRGFATVQTQWHNRSGRWCDGGVAPRAAVCSRNISSIHPFTDMSASPLAKAATQGQNIPTRRVVITNEEDMPTGLVSDAWLFENRLRSRILQLTILPFWYFCVAMCTLQTPDKCAVSPFSSLL